MATDPSPLPSSSRSDQPEARAFCRTTTRPAWAEARSAADALTLGLFTEFDDRQKVMLEESLHAALTSSNGRARAIANSYLGCALAQGRELTGVLAALEGSPELEQVKRSAERAYSDRCRSILEPFSGSGGISASSITAIFGAAEALSHAAVSGAIAPEEATGELAEPIIAVVGKH